MPLEGDISGLLLHKSSTPGGDLQNGRNQQLKIHFE